MRGIRQFLIAVQFSVLFSGSIDRIVPQNRTILDIIFQTRFHTKFMYISEAFVKAQIVSITVDKSEN